MYVVRILTDNRNRIFCTSDVHFENDYETRYISSLRRIMLPYFDFRRSTFGLQLCINTIFFFNFSFLCKQFSKRKLQAVLLEKSPIFFVRHRRFEITELHKQFCGTFNGLYTILDESTAEAFSQTRIASKLGYGKLFCVPV